jgi:hypothetical protein
LHKKWEKDWEPKVTKVSVAVLMVSFVVVLSVAPYKNHLELKRERDAYSNTVQALEKDVTELRADNFEPLDDVGFVSSSRINPTKPGCQFAIELVFQLKHEFSPLGMAIECDRAVYSEWSVLNAAGFMGTISDDQISHTRTHAKIQSPTLGPKRALVAKLQSEEPFRVIKTGIIRDETKRQ